MSIAIVRNSSGEVVTFVRPDLPVGFQPPPGCSAVPFADLPPGWQLESPPGPEPVTDTLAGINVTSADGKLTIPARLVMDGGDVQVNDHDRGIVLRDESGNNWLLAIAEGAVAAVQVSASPEITHEQRKTKLQAMRASVKAIKKRNKDKGKSKVTIEERIEALEKILGVE